MAYKVHLLLQKHYMKTRTANNLRMIVREGVCTRELRGNIGECKLHQFSPEAT